MTLFPADLADGGVQFGRRSCRWTATRSAARTAARSPWGVRPEDIVVGPADGKGLSVVVDLVEELGADGYLYGHGTSPASAPTSSRASDGRRHPKRGRHGDPRRDRGHVHAFDLETGERLNDAPVISGS